MTEPERIEVLRREQQLADERRWQQREAERLRQLHRATEPPMKLALSLHRGI